MVADQFEADIVVLDRLVAELKTLWADFAADHFTQILCYQKFWGIGTGLLFDFAKESLVHRRVAYTAVARSLVGAALAAQAPEFIADRPLMEDLCNRLTRIYNQYGLGYRDTTYRGLVVADLSADRVPCVDQPLVTVRLAETSLGQARLNCIAVDNRYALLIVALRTQINASIRAILQTYLRQLELRWGMVVNFGKSELQVTFVKAPH